MGCVSFFCLSVPLRFGRCCFANAFCIKVLLHIMASLESSCCFFYDSLLLHALTPFLCTVPIDVRVAVFVVVDVRRPPNFVVQRPICLGPFLPCPPVSRWVSDVVEEDVVEVRPCSRLLFLKFRLWRDRHLCLFFLGIVFKIMVMMTWKWCVHDYARRFHVHVDSR